MTGVAVENESSGLEPELELPSTMPWTCLSRLVGVSSKFIERNQNLDNHSN